MMYEVRTTQSRYWSESPSSFPAGSVYNLMGWEVAADVSSQSPMKATAGRSMARHALTEGRTVTVYINPAHLVEVIPLG